MIELTTAQSTKDLMGILSLQQKNLKTNLSDEEKQSQGFVTVAHSFEQLKQMNDIEPHVIAKSGDEVVAYVLSMTDKSRNDIPILQPMFQLFDETQYQEKPITDYPYMVVGQVCVDKAYRGQHLFDKIYTKYKEIHKQRYEFAITEVAVANTRSLRAHERVGFKAIKTYTDTFQIEWVVVLWDWQNQ